MTLIAAPGERCFGMAYRIDSADWEAVLEGLDVREKEGYEQIWLPLERNDVTESVNGLVYVAGEDNPNYLGPAPMTAIAEQVLASRGPSGENREYVLRLHSALVAMDADDSHVAELATLVAGRLAAGEFPA